MNNEWKECKLGEVADFATNKVDIKELTEANYISTENMLPNRGGIETSSKLPSTGKVNAFTSGDILFSNIRTYFKKLYYSSFDGGCSADVLVFRGRNSKTFNKYLYYILSNDKFFDYTVASSKGTKMPRGDKDAIMKYQINLPPLVEQKRISEILSSLDDKIELNIKMNKNLEEMAQAIFKQWFVDFEFPDENGNPYKSSGGKMIQSELGEIPAGWSVKELGECYNLTMGQSPPGTSYNEEGDGIVFYQGRTDFGFRFPTNRLFTTSPTRFAKKLDTLVSVRAPVGDINMANEDCCIGRGLSSIRHKTGSYSFTYYSMKNIASDFLKFESEGTVFGSINKNSFEKIEIIEPTKSTIEDFERIINGLDDKIFNNTNENQVLKKTRDSLLPKLMTGEIRV